jgi:hypothetical protein
MTWMLSILAVPVLYVLSVPVVIKLTLHPTWRNGAWAIGAPIPPWLEPFSQPCKWICKNTHLDKHLMAYADWVYSMP